MQPDPMRVEEVKAWLAKAARDLSRVELMLAAEPADVEGALFHAQQAAEKSAQGISNLA
jgi:HEPN domain-containing protein